MVILKIADWYLESFGPVRDLKKGFLSFRKELFLYKKKTKKKTYCFSLLHSSSF